MTPAPDPMTDDPLRERLKAFFVSTPDADMTSRWDRIWQDNFLPFDRGFANPALDEALSKFVTSSSSSTTHPSLILPPPIDPSTNRRRTALVPGCGRGYDVLLLSAYGYDAFGVEISELAAQAAEELKTRVERVAVDGADPAEAAGKGFDPAAGHAAVYATRDPKVGRGSARFLAGDFFAVNDAASGASGTSQWRFPPSPGREGYLKDIDSGKATGVPASFDVIVDYTFLCAFPHSWRPRWAMAMRSLLRDADAGLLCVEFPTYKDTAVRGPPWAMPSTAYLAVLGRPGQEVRYEEGTMAPVLSEEDKKVLESGKAVDEKGMVRVAHYKCGRTHEAGKDTDHVSVWKKVWG